MPYEYAGYDLSRMYLAAPPGVSGVTIYGTLIAHIQGSGEPIVPHHPIQCTEPSTWSWNGDDDMTCKHARVPVHDDKLQAAVTYSVACLLIEMASKL